ncbi:amino acid permease [Candidatus Woesearchaeota archaeon]|nr:amino acid permease [Candidatus Woesearchaeota archaeon]
MKSYHFFAAIATLVGAIIGAGILGIPYVAAKAGFLTTLIVIVVLGAVMMLVNLLLGEVVARTKGKHQLTGYASIYLGKFGKELMALSMIIGIYGALLAYIVGEGQVLNAIFGGTTYFWAFIFFIIASAIIYGGIEALERSELYMIIIEFFILLIIILALGASPQFDFENLQQFSFSKIFIPYGIVLFAYLGTASMPQLWLELKNHKLYKSAILWGSAIPIIIYALFLFSVLGVLGSATTQVATIGIGMIYGSWSVFLFNLFAFFTLATSFIALGFALKQMYLYDYKFNKFWAWILTIAVPFALYIFGFQDFTKILSITGAVSGGLAGILIVFMHISAKKCFQKKPEYYIKIPKFLYWLIASVFIIGALLEIVSIL